MVSSGVKFCVQQSVNKNKRFGLFLNNIPVVTAVNFIHLKLSYFSCEFLSQCDYGT